jgi:FimV-like protein
MRKPQKSALRHWRIAGLFLALVHAAALHAAGLGRLTVLSHIGQPFAGEIELLNVTHEELATLGVKLASAPDYQAANLHFDPMLTSLRLTVQRRANGTSYIRATSTRAISEPYLDLLVDLASQSGPFRRHYSALLSPAAFAETPAAATPAATAITAAPVTKVQTAPPARAAVTRPQVAPQPMIATAPKMAAAPVTPTSPSAPPAAAPTAVAKTQEAKPDESAKAKPASAELSAAEATGVKTEAAPPVDTKPAAKTAEATPTPSASASQSTAPASTTKADTGANSLIAIGGTLFALIAGLVIFLISRRGRQPTEKTAVAAEEVAKTQPAIPAITPAAATTVAGAAPAPNMAAAEVMELNVANVTDMVDPLEEAQVFLDHGSDEQGEKVLRDALAKHPERDDIRVKIAEILASRGDKPGFDQIITELRERTDGKGELWQRAAQLRAALDGGNASQTQSTKTLESETQHNQDNVLDFDFDSPSVRKDKLDHTANLLLQQDSTEAEMEKTLVLPKVAPKAPAPPAVVEPLPNIDFDIDLSTINMSLDDKAANAINPAFEVKSAHWEEVQLKFDLANAYQEMDDKDGMLQVLREIEREGDAAQQAAAQKMIGELK